MQPPLLWMSAYLPLLHRLAFAIPGIGVGTFERQTRRRISSHSLRIGGATALLASGADPTHIHTMVSARLEPGSSGYDATLGIVVDDDARAQSASEALACSLTRTQPSSVTEAARPRLCACPSVCSKRVFGDEIFCDFCNEFSECECAGDDTGVDRQCCVGSDDESDARRKQIQDGGRRLAAFVDYNFYGGDFASYAPRLGAAADLGELPSLGAACRAPMEVGAADALPARAGREAARAQGTSEAHVRSFTQPPVFDPERRMRLASHETEPVFDPELGVAPVFTAAQDGAGAPVIRDETGAVIAWPWDARSAPRGQEHLQIQDVDSFREEGYLPSKSATFGPDAMAWQSLEDELPLVDHAAKYFATRAPGHDLLGTHAADVTVQAGLNAATGDGKGGENSTGVRAYKSFCIKHRRAVLRPIDPNAPLWVKLSEELWAMRFISELVDDRNIAVDTAKGYFGAASKWHLRKTGVGFAAGVSLKRLGEMVKGLKKLRDGPPPQLRHGISPDQLRRGMDIVFPPTSPENVNIRAMLATMLQGLMRGREAGCEGTFDETIDLARGDIATAEAERLAFFMRPAKNMRYRRGKTVPIVIGGGGSKIDACAEVVRMLEMDPTPPGRAASTPMFRKADGSAFTTDDIRNLVRQIVAAIGLDPALFGAHSLRIGGATALFAAGADPIHIRTMGRWSSDCYRLYVRSCFEQTVAWTARIGSQSVHDVQGTYERQAQETECY